MSTADVGSSPASVGQDAVMSVLLPPEPVPALVRPRALAAGEDHGGATAAMPLGMPVELLLLLEYLGALGTRERLCVGPTITFMVDNFLRRHIVNFVLDVQGLKGVEEDVAGCHGGAQWPQGEAWGGAAEAGGIS